MKLKKIKAFTLAEVLVTLMIIGVIASMTIPTLMQNTGNNELVAGCLKAYSTLSQAIDRMKIDYGPVGYGKKWNDDTIFWQGEAGSKESFTAQINAVKIDSSGSSSCNPEEGMKFLDGSEDTDSAGYTAITADGMCFNYAPKTKCADKGIADGVPTSNDKHLTNCMGRFLVDVNGEKGPNVYGRDIYFFVLVKGIGILPAGADNNSAMCIKGGKGTDCAAKVIKNRKIDFKPAS